MRTRRLGSLLRMAVDLHTHTTASDGSDHPGAVVTAAAALGLTAVAVTDHDTQDGLAEAAGAGDAAGIEVVPGVELSLAWVSDGMHLLVLFLGPGPGPLQDRLAELRSGRAARNGRMVARLRELGMDVTPAEVEAQAGGGVVGRPHMAAVLVRKGYVPDIPTAFERYLASGRPAYIGRFRLEPEEAIRLARASGAVPVLAHPHTLDLTRDEIHGVLDRLVDAGLVGLECRYSTYPPEERRSWTTVARHHGLIPSGGSDYHGTYKDDVSLGWGRGDLRVPDRLLEELREARPGEDRR